MNITIAQKIFLTIAGIMIFSFLNGVYAVYTITKSSSSIDVVATDLADANTMMSKINFNTMYLQYTILGYTMQQTEDKVQTVKQLVADLKQELDAYEKYVKKPLAAKLRRTPFIGQINGVRLNLAPFLFK